ncbi:anthranilate phosphoribosyltransferase/anthranilate synthase/phosphoribosyltransferase [Oceanobacillus limi]|uniref:Anthranilate phosphoribosyltransferase n=1 Tax=Oceanobacillus limi TaxID=930131 RepID=A0A1I0CGD4_9BACI|nr:anthranilate phosphoribosyltransferase [Oceanobacillus limi]SET18663.1 anthranilate phosphoribosyltransferase/anthranilate synthase/phosphoribosyltransferase [Oceanobacillus limi]
MKDYLQKLANREDLTFTEMNEVANLFFSESTTDSEIAAVLMGLQLKGETPEEIAGLVEVLRQNALPFQKNIQEVMDNCGTGGDGSQSFNISSTSAFVIAGAGVKIAKHGNRSVSSKTGSADVLEELGVSLDFSMEEVNQLLDGNGIAFLFAPHVHPKLKQIMKVRQELRIPTIFNLIGPLTNPVKLQSQLLGIYQREKLVLMAKALRQLGRKRAIVVNGAGHLDEASLAGENYLVLLNKGKIKEFTIKPEDVGLNRYSLDAIKGGNARQNAEILLRVLKGEKGPYYETVLLNAGLALFAHGKATSVKKGVQLAEVSIESGLALEKLNHLIRYSDKRKNGVVHQ